MKCREGERLNGSHQRLFTVPVRPEVKAFFATPRLKRGGLIAKLVPLCTKKGRRKKKKKGTAREARVFTFHTYTFFKGTCISSKPYTVGA